MAIVYINQNEIPTFDVPSCPGHRYEAMVPDTLDLAERAALAIHGMTSVTDPAAGHEVYWEVDFWHDPPVMNHDWSSGSVMPKFLEAAALLRLASGSELNRDVERAWLETTLRMQGPDGLLYFPKKGRPWHRVACYGDEPPGDHTVLPNFNGRWVNALLAQYLLSGQDLWRETAERIIDGLAELADDHGDYVTYSSYEFGPGGARVPVPTSVAGQPYWVNFIVQGATHLYRTTGYEPARELAAKVARWLIDHSNYYGPDGSFAVDVGVPGSNFPVERDYPHLHSHICILQSLLEYGLATDDGGVIDFVLRGFEYGRSLGELQVGYFPETVGVPFSESAETCGVADMTAVAVKASAAGVGDYWDDVDRWTRNQLSESQMRYSDWVYRMVEKLGMTPSHSRQKGTVDEPRQTTDRVPERNVGCFAGWATPNDFMQLEYRPRSHGIMHCCTANGARALYYVWQNILHHADGKLRVNLLLNRASPWADVHSHLPYAGRVDLRIKTACDLSVRIPEWVKPRDVSCAVSEEPRELRFEGRCARVGGVSPDDTVTLTFPIGERQEEVWIEKRRYDLVVKGNDVVHIDPPGRNQPFYQRDHYRENATRWKETTRFVAERTLDW